MTDRLRVGRHREEHGFTAIEFVVILLIVGLLVAISVPTLVGARKRALDRTVKATLMTAFGAARQHYDRNGTYEGFDALIGESLEPGLAWGQDLTAPASGAIYVEVADGSEVHLIAVSPSGHFFGLHDRRDAGRTTYCMGATLQAVDTEVECSEATF